MCVIAAVSLFVAGCGGNGAPGAGETVVAAFYPLAFAAQHVAGPGVDVVDLTRAGEEPHDIELSPRDVARILDAKLVVYAGHGFQPAVEDAARERRGPTLDVLDHVRLRGTGDDVDPHVWLDPRRYAQVTRAIASALGDEPRAEPFVRRLDELDRELARGLRRCDRRTIVTSHAAFGYLSQRYGFLQVPIAGLSPDVEPSAAQLAQVADFVKAHGVTTIYAETLVEPAFAETVAKSTGAQLARLDPIEGLTSTSAGHDYLAVMRSDLATLRAGQGC